TGIGHERDKTLLDEVAHTAFDTPSKVIAGLERRILQQVQEVKHFMQTLVDKSYQQLHRLRLSVEARHTDIQAQVRQQLFQARDNSQQQFNALQMGVTQQCAVTQRNLPVLFHTVETSAKNRLKTCQVQADDYWQHVTRM